MMNKIHGILRSQKIVDGGSNTQMKSGELRWSFRLHLKNEDYDRYELFNWTLMEAEPDCRFTHFASCVCALLLGGLIWCKTLSSAAENYLALLDEIFKTKPIVAIKIAAIVAATSSIQYVLAAEAAQRVCAWLKTENSSERARIELALAIREAWPRRFPQLDGLGQTLLELLSKFSGKDPEYVTCVARLSGKYFGESLK